jgi:hypothetical protein
MEILLEAKDESDLTYMVTGLVAYNGAIEGVEGSELFHPRGSQFLICQQLRGLVTPIKNSRPGFTAIFLR